MAITLVACSSGGGGGNAGVNNLVTRTFDAVNDQAAKAAGVGNPSMSGLMRSEYVSTRGAFGAEWSSNPVFNNPITNSGSITGEEYMAIQLTPDAVQADNGSAVNVFGRLSQALRVFCAVGVATGLSGVAIDSNGYPENGTHSITFDAVNTAYIGTQCGMDLSEDIGMTLAVTVADSSAPFDKKFSFDSFTQEYLVRSTSTEINISTGELHDNGQSVSRSDIRWNRTTNVLRMQYVSNPGAATPAGLFGYRLYYDEENDEGMIFAYEGPDSSLSDATRYILAGKPQTGVNFSLSLLNPNINSGSDSAEGCVNASTGAIVDGARCAGVGADIEAGATATMMNNFFGQKADPAWQTVTPATTLNWSNTTDMLTADFTP